jgi:hypothetical protein
MEQTVAKTGRLMKKSDIEKIMKFNQVLVIGHWSLVISHWSFVRSLTND